MFGYYNFYILIMIVFDKNVAIKNPIDIAKILQNILKTEDKIDQEKEHFYIIHLNNRNNIKMIELATLGTLNSSLIHPRETYRRAILEGSAKIMIAHNHPSGTVEPSEDDLTITQQLKKAGNIIDIELLDHIIFTEKNYLSFKQKNLL